MANSIPIGDVPTIGHGNGLPHYREGAMLHRFLLGLLLAATSAVSVFAHHGWGSYDASKPITVTGPIETSKYENPHAAITVKAADKVWTVTLAPVSRMQSRGASPEFVGVGKTVSAYGYPSTVEKDEMRAERITVDGKTIEMR